MRTDTPRPILLKDYRPPEFLIDTVKLDIALNPTRTVVKSKLSVRANPRSDAAATSLRLDGEHLTLEALALNRQPLDPADYTVTETALIIHRVPDSPFTLDITTTIDPDANKALQGIYRSRGVYCSQCEAQGFRRITYFLDRPDVLATYRVRLEADVAEAPVLLANGNPIERGTVRGGRRHYAVWHDPHPKPCYLFAVVGGDLGSIASTFKTMSGRHVDLCIYVEHGKEERAVWAMDSLKRSMAWDERRFGREYDLDVFNIVAVSDFNMGAMENKGLNIFNDRLILASAETATDTMFESIEAVVAHEYFHNWTGNRITCRDWFQLCLKEGLTVYRDQEFSADERSRPVQRIADVRILRATQFPEDAGPLAHPVRPDSYIEINNFYTPTVYEKGAEVVRMLATILGEDTFRRGMDLYFDRHDGDAATIEDFLACFADVSGRNLTQFALWYSQSGTPQIVCDLKYDRATKSAELKVEQILPATPGQPKKKPMVVPIRLGLIGSDGSDMRLEDEAVAGDVILLTEPSHKFRFSGLTSKPVPSILRGFSAPVTLTIDLSDRDLEFLMTHDKDPFNRWQAANTYATRTLTRMAAAIAEGRRPGRATGLATALGVALDDPSLDPAARAEVLRLPTQSDIAREIGRNVNPDHIDRAHRHLLRTIGTELSDALEATYKKMTSKGAFSPDAKSAGKRALRNGALTLLSARGTDADLDRLSSHYFKARNMTDAAHALVLLAASDAPDRQSAVDHFRERWKDDHLVIDTWFSAQGQSPRADTLDRVERLTADPLFKITTPNKVRALIGAFAMSNPVQFNREDGAGYRFVAAKVLEIDRFNPQISARLLGAFRSFKALEPGRRAEARKALQRVAKAKELSRDAGEIVSRMLSG